LLCGLGKRGDRPLKPEECCETGRKGASCFLGKKRRVFGKVAGRRSSRTSFVGKKKRKEQAGGGGNLSFVSEAVGGRRKPSLFWGSCFVQERAVGHGRKGSPKETGGVPNKKLGKRFRVRGSRKNKESLIVKKKVNLQKTIEGWEKPGQKTRKKREELKDCSVKTKSKGRVH